MKATELLSCPVCGRDLSSDGKCLFCVGGERRHTFDIASSGYVNLLPPGKGGNAKSGDDKAMISSRSRFLDGGYYKPISDKVSEIISAIAENQRKNAISFADCACGEGYHTCNIFYSLAEKGFSVCCAGFDASKHGADRAAKRAGRIARSEDDDIFFAAGNIFHLPQKSGSVDYALSIFAPVAWEEMLRIMKGNGRLIVASSGERHLYELREILYDEPRTASGTVRAPDFFCQERVETLSYKITVTGNENVISLFRMTPFCYKTSKEGAGRLGAVDRLDVTVEVKFSVFSIPGTDKDRIKRIRLP